MDLMLSKISSKQAILFGNLGINDRGFSRKIVIDCNKVAAQ